MYPYQICYHPVLCIIIVYKSNVVTGILLLRRTAIIRLIHILWFKGTECIINMHVFAWNNRKKTSKRKKPPSLLCTLCKSILCILIYNIIHWISEGYNIHFCNIRLEQTIQLKFKKKTVVRTRSVTPHLALSALDEEVPGSICSRTDLGDKLWIFWVANRSELYS